MGANEGNLGGVDADVEVEAGKENGFAGGGGGSATPLVLGAADDADLPKPAKTAGGTGIFNGAAGSKEGVGVGARGAPNGDGDSAEERAGASDFARSSYSFCTSTRRLL